ncbi:MAG: magnesium/cobalt transporter CorA [Myxococcales bacterium]|nr:magnesium/cobalt transporter CorA [Myxococcales bacterium]
MTTRILAIRPGDAAAAPVGLDALPGLLADPDSVVWVDLLDPGEPERKLLEDVFKLHPTSIEDMLADAPTPKFERFDDYIYVVWHALTPGWEKTRDFTLCDLDVMIGRNYLLTSHNHALPSIEQAFTAAGKDPDQLRKGPASCAALIAEVLTERYLPLAERLDRDIDALETAIIRDSGPHLLQVIFDIKDMVQRLRRVGVHQREVLNRLSRGSDRDLDIVPEAARPFFRDAYDNFVRVVDSADGFKETVNSTMDAYLSMQGHKLNEIMKVLTLISTIMLPLTFIAGLYGMNFDPEASALNMPELKWRYGYVGTLAVMGITAVAFIWYFRRKRWL